MRKQTLFRLGIILSLAALALAACSGPKAAGPTVVNVTLSDFKIEMDKTNIQAGPVKFVITNNGPSEHEVVLELAGDNDVPLEANGKESEAENIDPGTSATLEWTIDKPGEYQLACHVPGHFEAGMVTTFSVTAP